jgi:hypothetical protein
LSDCDQLYALAGGAGPLGSAGRAYKKNAYGIMLTVTPTVAAHAALLLRSNLNGNPAVCGDAPALTGLNSAGTAIGTSCSAVGISPALESPPLTLSPSPDVVAAASPRPATPSPTPSGVPVGVVTSPRPAPPPVQISNQPVCTCAMAGYGSEGCKGAMATYCATKSDPACETYTTAGSDAEAANTLSQLLQKECFAGQNITGDACPCTTVSRWAYYASLACGWQSRLLLSTVCRHMHVTVQQECALGLHLLHRIIQQLLVKCCASLGLPPYTCDMYSLCVHPHNNPADCPSP